MLLVLLPSSQDGGPMQPSAAAVILLAVVLDATSLSVALSVPPPLQPPRLGLSNSFTDHAPAP